MSDWRERREIGPSVLESVAEASKVRLTDRARDQHAICDAPRLEHLPSRDRQALYAAPPTLQTHHDFHRLTDLTAAVA